MDDPERLCPLQAAGVIHTDFEGLHPGRDHVVRRLGLFGKREGLQRGRQVTQRGKEYVMQEGDVVLFRFNV